MSVDLLSITLEDSDEVRLWARRSGQWACLAVSGGTWCEIQLARVHLEALRDHLPDVLAGLDRVAAEEAECERAETAGWRAVDAAATALNQALLAEQAGAHDMAASLREAAAKATAAANAVDAAVRACGEAAELADLAAEDLIYAIDQAEAALRQPHPDDRPAEMVEA